MNTKMLRLFILLTAFIASISIRAQVVVNEYSCANWTQFLNVYQDTADWIERYNPSGLAIDLAG